MGISNKSVTLAIWGALGAFCSYPVGEFLYAAKFTTLGALAPLLAIIFGTTLWTTVLAIGCTMALIMGQNQYLRRRLIDSHSALAGIGGGAITGAVSGFLAESFFQIAHHAGDQNAVLVLVARLLAWAMFGCLIGLGMSFVIPNFGRLPGAISGAVGGGIGAIAFIVAGMLVAGVMLAIGGANAAAGVGDSLGRCIGMVILGFALGFAIGLAEEATRTAWLQVTYGSSRESVRISLGSQSVCVGSDSRRCAVWAKDARAVALKFRHVNGNVICDDIAAEKTFTVPPGYHLQVGRVSVLVCAGATASSGDSAVNGAPPALPPQPVPPPPPLPAGRIMRQSARPQSPRPNLNASGLQSGLTPARATVPVPPPPPPPPRRG